MIAITGCATGDAPSVPGDGGIASFDVRPYDGRVTCTSDSQCGDRIACTVDHCRSGACVHEACTDCCPDGLACVPDFGCRTRPMSCTMDAECDDSIRCTLDRCRDATTCEHTPQPELCGRGEVCLPAVGCIPEPPSTCTTAADCERGAVCVGEWSCQVEFGCQFVSLRDCSDAVACTIDACIEDRGGCVHDLPDVDRDMHSDLMCGGDDCLDMDAARHPGAPELCNGSDDDCDGITDEGCCVPGPCTTTCSTVGMQLCNPDGTAGACVPPAEACNGTDDDCDGMTDEGCCTSGPCMTPCGTTGVRGCDSGGMPGPCLPPAETCNGRDDDCNGMTDEGFGCVSGSAPTSCTTTCSSMGTRACLPGCTLDSCVPPVEVCNGRDDDCDAACDDGFGCCAGNMVSCTTMGFFAGAAACRTDCSGYDTAACTNCGNGIRNSGETCDGTDLGGASCTSLGMGFASGTLRCAAGCVFDTSSCTRCGNGVRDTGEACDGMDFGGATCASMGLPPGMLTCTPSCTVDTSRCMPFDPTGSYVTSPVPAYMCAFGLVNFTIGTFTFVDSGTLLGVNGAPCTMTGMSARASRMFDVQCTLPGSCDETYRLVGSFTTDDTWTGTFTANFVGSCFGCTFRSFSITGAR